MLSKYVSVIELAALAVLGLLAVYYAGPAGPLSRHMIVHIALMTAVAPVISSSLLNMRYLPVNPASIRTLISAMTVQIIVLLAWHSPPGIGLTMKGHAGSWLMQITLLVSASWFWFAVFNQRREHLWRSVIVLLLTGKLFCLVAVLLMFAPRALYMTAASLSPAVMLADQQLAGLLMVTVCPVSYVLASVLLITRWLWQLCEQQQAEVAAEAG
jgi:putative membrane protein